MFLLDLGREISIKICNIEQNPRTQIAFDHICKPHGSIGVDLSLRFEENSAGQSGYGPGELQLCEHSQLLDL